MVEKATVNLEIVSMVLMLSILMTSVNASYVKTFQVDPLTKSTMTCNLDKGEKFTGSVSISGGSSNDINFWVTDPQGTIILDFGRVNQGKSFEFTAQMPGAHTFHFDNSFSWFNSKTVSLTYDISTPILVGIDAGLLVIVIGVIIVLIVLLAVMVVFYRRKSTLKSNQVPEPPKIAVKTFKN